MVVTDYIASIHLYSFHSIVIEFSSFEEIFENNFIQVESVSNVVQKGSLLNLRSGYSKASLLFFDNIVSNNSSKLSSKGIFR